MMLNEEQVAPNQVEAETEPKNEGSVEAAGATTSPESEAPAEPTSPVASQEPTVEAVAEPAPAPVEVPTPEPVAAAPAPEPVVEASSAPAPQKSAADAADDMLLFEQAMAELDNKADSKETRRLSKGDRLEATVIQVEKDRVFVDLGTKAEGVVPLGELVEGNADSAHDHVQVGDKINVVVISPSGNDGNPVVSKKQADFHLAWNRVVKAFQEQTMLKAQVVDRVKGGLVVDVGVRGFVPATHVGSGKLRNIDKYVGETMDLKVIEIDRDRKKVVLSNRAAEDERREEIKDNIFNKVNPGDILEGTVRRLSDYGAFVDLGGIDGLLHISEMSWMRINHPKEVLKEGQKINVMVLRLDKENGKISLGLRQVLPDPWNLIKENYRIGQKIQCTITRMVQSGAFVRLPEGAEAFLPVSEIAHRRINKPSDVIADNQEVELTVIDLRPDERRMVLSLKAGSMPEQQIGYGYGSSSPDEYDSGARSAGHRGGPMKGPKKGKKKGGRDRGDEGDSGMGSRGSSGGGATIGERLGMLKGFHFRSEEPEDEAEATEEAKAEAPETNAEGE